jgi:diguanylate cyclase (GGDEF)-like protein
MNTLSQVQTAQRQAVYDATHDSLTGLPNRALFLERLSRTLERALKEEEYRFAVLFLDLDRFKNVNDSLGHVAGDRLLIEIARRLQACVHPTDTVARLGGDEFTILLEDIEDAENASAIAERIQTELERVTTLADDRATVRVVSDSLHGLEHPERSVWHGNIVSSGDPPPCTHTSLPEDSDKRSGPRVCRIVSTLLGRLG